jgi:chromosome segregation ATPase
MIVPTTMIFGVALKFNSWMNQSVAELSLLLNTNVQPKFYRIGLGRLRDRANELEAACNEQDQQKSKLLGLIKVLQEKLFGKDKEIKRLEARIASLKAENEAFRSEAEKSKAQVELVKELEQLKKKYNEVEKRRQELAQNNKSLGGRVAHTKRYKQQRDEARALIEQQKQQIATLVQESQRLREENERLNQIK